MIIVVYFGLFDPIINGYVDIIECGFKVFDEVIVFIVFNELKEGFFFVEECGVLIMIFMFQVGVRVDEWGGLFVDYFCYIGIYIVLWGLCAVADFEYEFQMVNMNCYLYFDMETIFMVMGADNFYVFFLLVREVAKFGCQCFRDGWWDQIGNVFVEFSDFVNQ